MESQIKLLSDHLVELTDKIRKYEDELTVIKSHRVRCGKCKTWNTVGWLIDKGQNGRFCSRGNHPSSFNFA